MVIAIVQARLGSTRFPRKVLADLLGRPVITHVLTRAQQIAGVDLVLAVIPKQDVLLEQAVRSAGVFPVLGSEEDVLSRFVEAVKGRDCDTIMRITGDCPVFSVTVAEQVLALHQSSKIDYTSNDTLTSGFPDGWDIEVFTADALAQANAHATGTAREHVTPWMRKHLKCATLKAETPWTGPKLSIDTEADLATVAEYLSATETMPASAQKSRRKRNE